MLFLSYEFYSRKRHIRRHMHDRVIWEERTFRIGSFLLIYLRVSEIIPIFANE